MIYASILGIYLMNAEVAFYLTIV